jgi:predicted metal-dependent phosphoesterase TrpH
VKGNGGIPIVAHPGLNLKGKEDLVTELIGKGAEGLEVFNNYHELNQIEYFADLVMKDKLLMTCGSDFHGKNKPLIEIGKYIYDNRYDDYLQNCVNQINT